MPPYLDSVIDRIDQAKANQDTATEHALIVLDPKGEQRITWDVNDPLQVEGARRMFNHFRLQGFAAYRLSYPGEGQDEMTRDFNPNSKTTIMHGPMVGG